MTNSSAARLFALFAAARAAYAESKPNHDPTSGGAENARQVWVAPLTTKPQLHHPATATDKPEYLNFTLLTLTYITQDYE